jgi:Right handed beta helix region
VFLNTFSTRAGRGLAAGSIVPTTSLTAMTNAVRSGRHLWLVVVGLLGVGGGTPASAMVVRSTVTTSVTADSRFVEIAGTSRSALGAHRFTQAACSTSITDHRRVNKSLATARPGTTVCLAGSGLGATDMVITRSGTRTAPLRVQGDNTRVHSVRVTADHVIIEGFNTFGGDGIDADGTDITIRNNVVVDADLDGISCGDCTDSLIQSNTVDHADGTGIRISGANITIDANVVQDSVRINADDADGVRFFGYGHRITGNFIADIKDDGYTSAPPHTDCFQTFDNGKKLATYDVLIRGNTCTNVDHQCLIATAQEAGLADQVGRSTHISFVDNTCDVEGSQAVLVRWFPNVEVRRNTFKGSNMSNAIVVQNESTGAWITDNSVEQDIPTFEVDPSSADGFTGP